MKSTSFFIFFLFLFYTACGKKDSASSPQILRNESFQEAGEYRVVLNSLNATTAKHHSFGTATIHISDNDIEVKVTLTKSISGMKHVQSIHASSECPSSGRDLNQDAFLDILEGSTDFGKILIPLDGDLTTQALGSSYSPSGHSYSYTKKTTVSELMSDLYAIDENPTDFIIKLKANAPLNLTKRTMVILGARTTLPSTVASIQDLSSEASLPIACGKIVHIQPE